jgi:hypothetical protein
MSNTDWLTLALVVITGFYAWATFRILRANEAVVHATRMQTEAQSRPYVVIAPTVRSGTTLVCLEVLNTGRSPALDLRLKLDRDFYPHAELRPSENLANLPAFSQNIESLAPGTRLIFVLGVGGTIFAQGVDEGLCPKVFGVSANYRYGDTQYVEQTTIDVRPMLHSTVAQDPVANELEKLRAVVEKW